MYFFLDTKMEAAAGRRVQCPSPTCKGQLKRVTVRGECCTCRSVITAALAEFMPKCPTCQTVVHAGDALCVCGRELREIDPGEPSQGQMDRIRALNIEEQVEKLRSGWECPVTEGRRDFRVGARLEDKIRTKILNQTGFSSLRGNNSDSSKEIQEQGQTMLACFRGRADDKVRNRKDGTAFILHFTGGVRPEGFKLNFNLLQQPVAKRLG